MTERGKGLLAINGAVLLFGIAGLFGKLLVLSPVLIVLGRVAFASLALLLYQLGKKEVLILERRISHYAMMILSGVLLAFHWWTFFHSIQVSTVAVGLISFSTFPVYVALLEPLLFREKFSLKHIILAFLILVGIRMLLPRSFLPHNILQGVLWGSVSGLLFAFLTLINRKMVSFYPAGTVALYQNFIAFIVLLPFSFRHIGEINWIPDIYMLIFLGVIFTALSHTLFIYGLKTVKARIASIIACLEPVYGIVLAILILSEIPGQRALVGGVIVIGTVFYTILSKKQVVDKQNYRGRI